MSLKTSGPLVLARGSGRIEASDAAMVTGAIDARLAGRKPFLVVVDALGVEAVEAAARRHVGDHRNLHKLAAADLDLGMLVALRSPVVRGALTAISWLSGAFGDLRTVEQRAALGPLVRDVCRQKNAALGPADDAALAAFVAD